jgi:hypothetical protein
MSALGLPYMSCKGLVACLSFVVVALTHGSDSEVSRINMTQLVVSAVATALAVVGPYVGLGKRSVIGQVARLLLGAGLLSLSIIGLSAADNSRRAADTSDARDMATLVLAYLSSSVGLVCGLGLVSAGSEKVLGAKL